MNKKSSPASSDDKISPRKASTADTSNDVSDGTSTSMKSREKKIYYCSSEGCTNQVINSGVCNRHGAKVKRCSREGCTNIAKKGGLCIRHGAKVKRCSSEGRPTPLPARGRHENPSILENSISDELESDSEEIRKKCLYKYRTET
eukprot:scaffold39069_cov154-Skeletonema_marinoi.AAC.19